MTEKPPDISIGVSSWNTSDIVEEALQSIVATAGDLHVDVTVIDDASTDGGLASVAEKFKNDHRFFFIRNDRNQGVPSGNVTLGRSKAPYIVTLDSDARLLPGALQRLYEFMEAHPEAGAVTANLINPDGSAQVYYRRILTPMRYLFTTVMGRFVDKYFLGLRNFNSYRYVGLDLAHDPEIEQTPTACLMLRREAIGTYIFDPLFRIIMPDVDLCKRIRDNGYKIYLASAAKVVHLRSISINKKGKAGLVYELNRGALLYFKKHYPLWVPLLWTATMLDRFLRAVIMRMTGRDILH